MGYEFCNKYFPHLFGNEKVQIFVEILICTIGNCSREEVSKVVQLEDPFAIYPAVLLRKHIYG